MYFLPIGEMPKRKRTRSNRDNPFDAIYNYEEIREWLDKMQEAADKKKKEKAKPEVRKFTFLETAGLCFIFGPWLGVGTLYGIKIMLHSLEGVLK